MGMYLAKSDSYLGKVLPENEVVATKSHDRAFFSPLEIRANFLRHQILAFFDICQYPVTFVAALRDVCTEAWA